MASGGERPAVSADVGEIQKGDENPVFSKPPESPKVEESSEEEEESEFPSPSAASNGHFSEENAKRMRKKVQRLSETLSEAHAAMVEQRAKAAKELLEAGNGTALGDIPSIETNFRKMQPISLKPLHLVIYGRLGAITEVRSNLRKFRGFPFKSGSPEYNKKLSEVERRTSKELREVLRILNLEVSGSREQIATRLLDFLLEPNADKVKYKGQVKRSRRSVKKESKKKTKKTPSARKTPSSEGSGKEVSHTEEDTASDDGDSNVSSLDDESSGEEYSSAAKKPAQSKGRNSQRGPRKRRARLDDSDSETNQTTTTRTTPKHMKVPKKSAPVDSDEDAPLSAFASSKKPTPPSDSELKEGIIALLKTVNLEETSLRVVREQIFSRYPGVDLSGKRDFINTTVKEYLAQS